MVMKEKAAPARRSTRNEATVKLRSLTFVPEPILDGQSANASIVRESSETAFMNLRGPGASGIDSFRLSSAHALLSCMPGDRTALGFGPKSMVAVPAGDEQHNLDTRSLKEPYMTETGNPSPDSEIANGGSPAIAVSTPSSSHAANDQVETQVAPLPTILVIDDELLDMELLADTLGTDYEMLFATEGIAGLEIAVAKSPDLILLDVMMPGIDGYEVYKRLRENPRTNEIPVIFITGLGDVAAETRGLTLGAVDYITKPINPEPVKARVHTQIKAKLTRDKLTQLASTDGLTGLANRSYFDAMLAYECARHARSGAELSLILLDIDHFKIFNDTYGHVCGDDCLREVAHAISAVAVRATDIVARYGGEEFVLLLPETHLQGAVMLAEKVRKSISNLALPHKNSAAKHVTASLGVASARMLPGSVTYNIVEEADKQLYAAKAGGRNRVSFRKFDEAG
jgi:diguanylate cyclase (GGDEF)-like protein